MVRHRRHGVRGQDDVDGDQVARARRGVPTALVTASLSSSEGGAVATGVGAVAPGPRQGSGRSGRVRAGGQLDRIVQRIGVAGSPMPAPSVTGRPLRHRPSRHRGSPAPPARPGRVPRGHRLDPGSDRSGRDDANGSQPPHPSPARRAAHRRPACRRRRRPARAPAATEDDGYGDGGQAEVNWLIGRLVAEDHRRRAKPGQVDGERPHGADREPPTTAAGRGEASRPASVARLAGVGSDPGEASLAGTGPRAREEAIPWVSCCCSAPSSWARRADACERPAERPAAGAADRLRARRRARARRGAALAGPGPDPAGPPAAAALRRLATHHRGGVPRERPPDPAARGRAHGRDRPRWWPSSPMPVACPGRPPGSSARWCPRRTRSPRRRSPAGCAPGADGDGARGRGDVQRRHGAGALQGRGRRSRHRRALGRHGGARAPACGGGRGRGGPRAGMARPDGAPGAARRAGRDHGHGGDAVRRLPRRGAPARVGGPRRPGARPVPAQLRPPGHHRAGLAARPSGLELRRLHPHQPDLHPDRLRADHSAQPHRPVPGRCDWPWSCCSSWSCRGRRGCTPPSRSPGPCSVGPTRRSSTAGARPPS